MRPLTLSVKTENIPFPAHPARAEYMTGDISVRVETVCLGQARRLASDFSLALEYGAAPAAQARMIEEVREAERKGIPLSCLLSFGM